MKKSCLSEVSYSLGYEESREKSCSFASRERMRSFLRTTPAPLNNWGARYVQPSLNHSRVVRFGLAGRKTKTLYLQNPSPHSFPNPSLGME